MKALVKDELEKLCNCDIILETPKDKNLGHYAAPMFSLAKSFKKSPVLIAKEISEKNLDNETLELSAINGYLNIHLRTNFLDKLSINFLKSNFTTPLQSKNNKILIEFVSANPTGPLHIGHVRGAVYGDTLARVGRYLGYDVTTEYYINDAGNQIESLGLSILLAGKKILFKVNENLDEESTKNYYKGEYINDLVDKAVDVFGKEIFNSSYDDKENITKLSIWGKDCMLKAIKKNLSDANISIENWVSEASLYNDLNPTISRLKECGGAYEKDGKVWIKSSELGDEKDRVIIREDGRPTYLAGDIIYHYDKLKRGYDHYINIWGADHHGYIDRVKASIHFLGYDENCLEIILAQMVSLLKNGESFKMSKRAGNFILMGDVLEEIGSDALRFIFISKKCDTPLEFDIDKLKVQDSSNPIFYVNYAHARINQIFLKANKTYDDILNADISNIDEEAKNLLFEALTFDDVLEDAFNARAMQKIPDYLKNLSSSFHKFYNENKVIGSQNEDALLKIFAVVGLTIKKALWLIGIKAKDKMEH